MENAWNQTTDLNLFSFPSTGHICSLNWDFGIFFPTKNCRITKTNMDCKEEISDSDSGIILNSGECFHFYVNDK